MQNLNKIKKQLFLIIIIFLYIKVNAQQWTGLPTFTTNWLGKIHFVSEDTGFVTDGTRLYKTVNGGNNWPQVGPTYYNIFSPFFFNGTTGFVCGPSGIYKTTNGGLTFTDVFPDSVLSILTLNFPTTSIGYASAIAGANYDTTLIYKTTNGGNNWSLISSMQTAAFPQMHFYNANIGYLNNNYNEILKTTDGGNTWNMTATLNINNTCESIFFPSQDTGFVTSLNEIHRTIDGGNTWIIINTNTSNAYYNLFFLNSLKGFAVGGNLGSGIIEHTIDGGSTWTPGIVTSLEFASVFFPSRQIGYACGSTGQIKKYDASLGFSDVQNDLQISIFPNPSTGIFTLQKPTDTKAIVVVYDVLGNQCLSITLSHGEGTKQIDMSNFAKGIYHLQLTEGDKVYSQKIVIQ